ncbi:helix-turn-helix domain-containing protein [Salipiger abyssi]|uniref:helix-turn-helix domain-containing protein n=1 Tax=Salipiger abyssi TaxID=1250539 RepID=UPI001A8E706A|nr:helix-turn-helix domain-containing protein [Salipiger abyssi]MBN9890564.1 helix-turn-helix domain-containing protein [Salipiger abyssi]
MYTLGQAAKEAGCSKATISRAIKNGKLSASRLEDNSYQINPAELQRWVDSNGHRNSKMKQIATQDETAETPRETSGLQVELEALRQIADDRQKTIDDLRQRLDAESEERRKLTAMVTDQRQPPKGFWARLTGR